MIQAKNLSKRFYGFTALDSFHAAIPEGAIYGLVGSNGSGKSTLLRTISGIYRPDGGEITIDGEAPFENIPLKGRVFFVADDLHFFPQATMDDMASFYARLFPGFDRQVYQTMCQRFPIDPGKRINTFSKGMKRQVALILALSCQPDYLLLDEAFDGLDPIIRGALRRILADQVAQRRMTVVIASHNLRELEDMCDVMGLLHQGRVVFEREIDAVKLGFCKVQAGFRTIPEKERLEQLDIMQMTATGSVLNLVVRGGSGEVMEFVNTLSPFFVETVPLTLEEVFIYEMEAHGYDYNKIIF